MIRTHSQAEEDFSKFRHSRAGGKPVVFILGSRLRGNDE